MCPEGMFGLNCTKKCACRNDAKCDPIDGTCTCEPGWKGKTCSQRACKLGFYGENCAKVSCDFLPSKRKWIEIDRNGFVLFVSNPDSDLLNPFLSN